MKYDNVRDSQAYGFDAGVIVEGSVVLDEVSKEYVIVDDEGTAFSSQEFLKKLVNRSVRLTCVDMESAQKMEEMLKQLQGQGQS